MAKASKDPALPLPIQELQVFDYLIFQPNPTRERVSVWENGSKAKRILTFKKFLELIDANIHQKYANIQQILNTYSFYFVSVKPPLFSKLNYSDKNTIYKDNVTSAVQIGVKNTTKVNDIFESLSYLQLDIPEQEKNDLVTGQPKTNSFLDAIKKVLGK